MMPGKKKQPDDLTLSEILGKSPEDQKDKDIAALQNLIAKERDGRLVDKFISVVVIILIFDSFIFANMQTWGGPVSILFLEIVLLVVLGRQLGVDDVKVLTERIIDSWSGSGKE